MPVCVLQYFPMEMNKYDNVDVFAGERAISRAFRKRNLRSTALDICISERDATVLPYVSAMCTMQAF